jgi:hypothetical protein
VRERQSCGGLDALGEHQVPRARWSAPQHDASGRALAVAQLSRLLRIARLAIGSRAELGLALSAGSDIDPVRVAPAVWRHGAEHDARVVADELRLAALLCRRVVVG